MDRHIADLIGEIDPIKVAEGHYLSDELVIHYGLVPRTNRGIFCINELPDLAERIQVGLFNLMEERDIQIRGFRVRLPVDVCVVATANPEDYTNRGRIITPLKDRYQAQIRTHYPLDRETEIAIVDQEVGEHGVQGLMFEVLDDLALTRLISQAFQLDLACGRGQQRRQVRQARASGLLVQQRRPLFRATDEGLHIVDGHAHADTGLLIDIAVAPKSSPS